MIMPLGAMGSIRVRKIAREDPQECPRARITATAAAEVLLVIAVVLAFLAAVNTIFTTWATVLDTRRFAAVARPRGHPAADCRRGPPSRPYPPASAPAVPQPRSFNPKCPEPDARTPAGAQGL